ncbi:MAG: hypothetical protein AB1894_29360 [Chloroflexota bacterium]
MLENSPFWLSLATGPVMRFALTLMVLGLLRLVALTVWDMVSAVRRAQDRSIPYFKVIRETFSWLFPFSRLHRTRRAYSFASFGLHMGVLIVGLFLSNHIDILLRALLLSSAGPVWPAVNKLVLDGLTLVTIVAGLVLLFYRLYVPSSRTLSKSMDYILLVLILNIFVSGFIAGQDGLIASAPVSYDQLMLFHTLNGLVLLATIPFTKVSHCVLFPLIRLGSEIAWHMKPGGGNEVVDTLYGPEGRRI